MPFPKKNKIKCICQECGKEFETFPYLKDKVKYCGKECKYKAKAKREKLLWSFKKKKKVILVCQNELCKKQFVVPNYKKDKRKYCSRDCYLEARKRKHQKDIKIEEQKQSEIKKRDIWKLNSI